MTGAAIALRGVRVRYAQSDREAVAGVDLDIAAGEVLVLLGASGSGKSTLLRTINRLVAPSAGTITIDGQDTGAIDAPTLRRGIGYVIQAVGLFPHYTVARNIAIVPELQGWDRARIDARIDALLDLVRLEPARYRDRLPRELSGGEAQRVGVARALAVEPPVLLMDEPFGALDAIVRTALQDEVLHLHRELGPTIVFVTHDVDEALRLADRIGVMRDGALLQVATPLELLVHPVDPFVAELIDASNVLRRLGVLHVRDAARPGQAASAASTPISAQASLRDALGRLLVEDGPIAVGGGGAIDLAAIRAALRP